MTSIGGVWTKAHRIDRTSITTRSMTGSLEAQLAFLDLPQSGRQGASRVHRGGDAGLNAGNALEFAGDEYVDGVTHVTVRRSRRIPRSRTETAVRETAHDSVFPACLSVAPARHPDAVRRP